MRPGNFGYSKQFGFGYAIPRKSPLIDFRRGTLPSGVTLTRASTGTYVDSAGVLQTAAIDAARFNYLNKGVLGIPSLLVEPASTNLWLRSQEFDNAVWTKGGASIDVDVVNGPDGTATADLLKEDTSNGLHSITGATPIVSLGDTFHGGAIYVNAAGRTRMRTSLSDNAVASFETTFRFDTGVISSNPPSTSGNWSLIRSRIDALGSSWFRVSTSGYLTGGAGRSISLQFALNNNAGVSYTGDGTSGENIWGAQFENARPSSYIPTTTGTVTRSADVCSFTIPAGVSGLLYLFDNNTTQYVAASPGSYQIPTNLNSYGIQAIWAL